MFAVPEECKPNATYGLRVAKGRLPRQVVQALLGFVGKRVFQAELTKLGEVTRIKSYFQVEIQQ